MRIEKTKGLQFGLGQFEAFFTLAVSISLVEPEDHIVNLPRQRCHRIDDRARLSVSSHFNTGMPIEQEMCLCGHTPCLDRIFIDSQHQANDASAMWIGSMENVTNGQFAEQRLA